MSTTGYCRSCGAPLKDSFIDLGEQPLANDFRQESDHEALERHPLHAWICATCMLVQIWPTVPPERLFTEYSYLSSTSSTWLEHAREFARGAIERLSLNSQSRVVEIASNDGYLLRNFVEAGIPCLGIEPAENVAEIARRDGVDTLCEFFGATVAAELVHQGSPADLVVANNVLAHVPNLPDFVTGLATLVTVGGLVSIEFPGISTLLSGSQFDTIYHEHCFYLSLTSCQSVLARGGLRVVDVESLPTHGGSLRVWAARLDSSQVASESVDQALQREADAGLDRMATYHEAARRMRARANEIEAFVRSHVEAGAIVAGYGAAAKTTVVANFCNLGAREIRYVVDRNPLKHGCRIPGTSIPVLGVEHLRDEPPDVLVIFPWNLAREIIDEVAADLPTTCRIVSTMPVVEDLAQGTRS